MQKSFVCFLLSLLPLSAMALNSINESGEIVPEGTYRLGFEPQIKVSDGGGANFSLFADRRLREDMSVRLFAGAGDTDFVFGSSLKWIPFPDFENQPAFGGRVRAQYMREATENFFGFAFDPLVSKKFEVDQGVLNAYAALPITGINHSKNSVTSVNIVIGTEYINPEYSHYLFGAELGIEGKDSFSYISGFMTISFDDEYNWIKGN